VFSGLGRVKGMMRSGKESKMRRRKKKMRRGVRTKKDDQMDLEDGDG
jgi:hypothetical protein